MYSLLIGLLTVCSSSITTQDHAANSAGFRKLVLLSDTTKARDNSLYRDYYSYQKQEQLIDAGINRLFAGSGSIEWTSGQRSSLDSNYTISRSGSSGNADLFMISPSGHVGIGTLAPGNYKLAVEGTIGARKIQVKLESWADYVFEPGYKLPTLAEVENFIKQHGRLPEVPSARQVEESGIDVGANQALLLKKIEELTLYMIELKKENDQLRERVVRLEKE
ncbi:MAG: hypothetical protein ABW007_12835 [Chitinophagaceae bacterium]